MVAEPDRVEVALTRFWVVVEPDVSTASLPWKLTVTRSDGSGQPPRVVQQETCAAAVEAAVLVVSAWIDEQESKPEAKPEPPPKSLIEGSLRDRPRASSQLGVTLSALGALRLAPGASAGTSLEVWFRNRARNARYRTGIAFWPTALYGRRFPMEATDYSPPYTELYGAAGGNGPIGACDLVFDVGIYLGLRKASDTGATTVTGRLVATLAADFPLTEDFRLSVNAGVGFRGTLPSVHAQAGVGVAWIVN